MGTNHMTLKSPLLSSSVRAQHTSMRFLSGVSEHMPLQAFLGGEPVTAELTGKGFLTSVPKHVSF